jgi:hypothetical protein
MSTASHPFPTPSDRTAPGPHFGVVAIVSAVLFCASVSLFESVHGLHFPYPGDTAATMATYFSTAAARVQLGAFLQCGSAMALGIVTASATTRMRSLGACDIGIRVAFLGGSIAALLSLVEAGVVWILAQPGVADTSAHGASVVRALYLFAFMLDGPAYAASLGLLIAGLAVAGLLTRLLPRAELPLDADADLRHAHSADALPWLPLVDNRRIHPSGGHTRVSAESRLTQRMRMHPPVVINQTRAKFMQHCSTVGTRLDDRHPATVLAAPWVELGTERESFLQVFDENAYFGGQSASRSNRKDRHSSFEGTQKT